MIDLPPDFKIEPQSLEGRTALVTGGTTGIGRATARLLDFHGCRTVIFGRSEEHLADALEAIGGDLVGLVADASVKGDMERVFDTIDQRLGRLDILVNNAAVSGEGPMTTPYEDMEYIVRVNLLGYLHAAQLAAERMIEAGRGVIVNIGSMSADDREANSSIYAATKSGVQGFNEAFAKEVNGKGIRVCLIEPGAAGSDMNEKTPEEQRQLQMEGKLMTSEDIAAAVLFCLRFPLRTDIVSLQMRPHLLTN
jgi:NADP-dependent 3-hydroxy acid dehydrogenase YdfG